MDNTLHPAELLRGDLRSLVEKDYIAELNLLDYKTFDIFFLRRMPAQGFSAIKFALHPQGIHHRHDGVKLRYRGIHILRHEHRHAAYGLRNRSRLADSACLDDDIVKIPASRKVTELRDKVHFQGAADTSVLERDETVVRLGDNASLPDKVSIDIDLTYVIDNHGKLDSAPVG